MAGMVFALTSGAGAAAPAPGAYQFAAPAQVGGASEAGMVPVTMSAAGTLGTITVITQGVPNQDFSYAAGGSCATGLSYFAGQTCSVGVTFQPRYPGQRQGAVLLRASDGSLLGSELLIATGVGATGVFVPGMITTVAGDGQWIYRGDGGLATQSPLFLPMGGAADAAGDLFLSDSNNQRVRRVDAVTGIITTVAGDGTAGFAGDGGLASSAMLDTPADTKLDGAGNLYIADSANHAIRMVNAVTGIITTIAGIGGQEGYSGDGGQATQAHLAYPSGIAFDGNHALYISDTDNNVIRRVDLSTGIITTVAGTGAAGYAGDGGPATSALLNSPWGIALDGAGNLYIADLSNNCVRKVSGGTISTLAGTGTRGYGGDAGPAVQAELNVPAGVVADVAGNLYVADSGNHLVRKISATTGIIETIAGAVGAVTSGDGGPAIGAQLDGPYALFLDGPGNLYIADYFDNLMRVVYANATALSYPVMRVNSVSAPQPEVVENDGNSALNFSAFTLVSNSALDSASTTCSTSQSIAVNQTCALGVEFAPTVIGTLVTGSISLVSNAANSPATINLSGQVLLVQPTQISLTPSANPATVGTAVTFTAVVSNGAAMVPTGTVTFMDGTAQIGMATLTASGAATLSTATLAPGVHQMTAVYSGDPNNAPATSGVLAEHMEQPTTTVLVSSVNPSVAEAGVTFTATVQGPAGVTGVPTGTVTFSDGAVPLGTSVLNASGVATLTVSRLSAGQHNITASYGGDSANLASQSAILVQTVAQATTATLLTTSSATVYAGVSVTFTAVVSRTDTVIPTGSVTFMNGATAMGTGTLDGTGTATLATSALAAGSHSISAIYTGDTNNLTSTSASLGETVQQIPTATTIAASANPGTSGAALVLTATVAQSGTLGAGGAFSGTMTFQNGAATLGTATVSAAGVATLTVSTLAAGANTVTAVFAGNTNYVGSTSSPMLETIVAATTTTTLASSQTPSIAGRPVTFTAVVTGTGGVPTGAVTFIDAGVTLGSGTLNASGVATLTATALAVGQHTLTAAYGGDSRDSSSTSATLLQTVQIATTSTTVASSANPSGFGTAVTFTAGVTTNGGALTGTVTFSDGATVLGSAAVNAGTAVWNATALALGTHSITVAYSGDANNAASQSAALSQQVLQAGGVALTSSANPAIATTSVTFSATVAAPQGVAITGTVTFRDGATVLGTGSVGAGGVATFSNSTLTVGQHQIVASYSGDANNLAATSGVLVQTVQIAGTTVTLISSANPALTGAPLTLTSTVTGTGGSVTGTVTFEDGTATLGAANLNSAGVATFQVSGLSPGVHSIIAVYGGDGYNSQSSSPVLAENVVQATTVALTSSQNPSLALDPVTFTAKVANSGSKPPTGTVVFSDGTTVLGSVTLDATGTASFAVTSMAFGQHPISAAYGGDVVDLASVSATMTQSVQLRPTSEVLTASSTSLTGGQQVTLIAVLRFAGPVAATGNVTFTSNGATLGTTAIDSTGVATFTANLLTNSPTVIATYSGDSVYAGSTSAQTSITVTPPTQFSIQINPPAVTLQSQQHSTVTLTLASVNNFSDTLDMGCLGLPYAATCTFSKDSVTLGAGGTQTLTVVVDTGSPLTAGSQAKLERHEGRSAAAMCILPGGLLLGLLLWSGRGTKRNRLAGLMMLLLLAGLASGLSGCSGLNINGTPAGTYVFQITATGTGTGVSESADITLTVTQ
jgi:predicted secreted protein